MQLVKFYENEHERGVELILSKKAPKVKLYFDLIIAVDDDIVTIKYPLSKEDWLQLQNQSGIIKSILMTHGLTGSEESKFHHSNLLYTVLEFNVKYKDLLNDKKRNARLHNTIDFLKRVKHLTPVQKQNVEMSFTINGELFKFEDQPFFSEIVINKLSGVMMNTMKLYPELWEAHLKRGGNPKAYFERVKADSKLQNQAVAEITKLLIKYLNSESPKLQNHKAKPDKLTLTSKQGAFIFDLLDELDIYKPRDIEKSETGRKEANYHGLRKLIERY